ncbi:MAG: hypothetical protein JRI57_00015 [Deltaproteobacteria bacterium]|nr:hypothetical protein [Deltaproteobacteria bacterium]MBW2134994.1 hypothetical protein [Deltaproteobacteria bacterium]
MRDATVEYIQEERRLRGAKPLVKAVLYPYDLDYGLAENSGDYVNTEYGGVAGKLAMQAGYKTSGAWTGPVMQAHTANLNRMIPSWKDQAGYLETVIRLRSAAEYGLVSSAPYQKLTAGQEYDLNQFFQIQVEFDENIRAWAVEEVGNADNYTAYAVDQAPESGYQSYASDGEFPGYLEDLGFEGQIHLADSEIISPGEIAVDMALDFSDLRAGTNALEVDNRKRQWIPGGGSFYLQELPWYRKFIRLYHGFELANGSVEWQLVYIGKLLKISQIGHSWQGRHTAVLETADLIMEGLQKKIGVPDEDGTKRPFMRGYYRDKTELISTDEAFCDEPIKNGSGSATLYIVDDSKYAGEIDKVYLIEAETTGELGTATCKWSKDGGQTWEKTEIVTASAAEPLILEYGLEIYWTGGAGDDFVAGDQWEITAHAKVYHYRVYGAPFQEITGVYLNDEEVTGSVAASAETGEITVVGKSGRVEARVVKDDTRHPVDIIEDILTQVGLVDYISPEHFAQARADTLEYNIGVRFEDLEAARAIQAIVAACLYEFWVDFGEIKIRAYLGED